MVEGTTDDEITKNTDWKEYKFWGKPTDTERTPGQVAPYHLRLDWQMWFLPFRVAVDSRGVHLPYGYPAWFVGFMKKLLQGDEKTGKLIRENPFKKFDPEYVRAKYYKYEFTNSDESTDDWWSREEVGDYLEPVNLGDLRWFLC